MKLRHTLSAGIASLGLLLSLSAQDEIKFNTPGSATANATPPGAPAPAPATPPAKPTYTEVQVMEAYGWLMGARMGLAQLEFSPANMEAVSRGMALGYTMSLPQEDRYLHSKTEFEDKIAGMLGGHVSEEIVFEDTTTGASNDIEKATTLARAMVTQYGMSEALGPLAFGKKDEMIFLGREISEQRNYSDEVAAKIDAEVRSIIDNAYARAHAALIEHRAVLDRLADLLVEKETIEAAEFEALWDGVLPPRDVGGPTPSEVTPDEEVPAPAAEDEKTAPRRRRGPAPQPA